jgi:hypothetical protein
MQLAGYNFQNGQRSPDSTNKGTSWKRKKKRYGLSRLQIQKQQDTLASPVKFQGESDKQ